MPLTDEIRQRVDRNLMRVATLVALYRYVRGEGKGRSHLALADILRASVVFLHATLEDFLRTLALQSLPTSSREALDRVPLLGLEGRAEKFSLGALSDHRGKTVDDLIRESVKAHLERSSYSSTREVATLLVHLNIDPKMVNARFADLDSLMERRHHIVHQADFNPKHGSGHHRAKPIDQRTVLNWIQAVQNFIRAVDAQLP